MSESEGRKSSGSGITKPVQLNRKKLARNATQVARAVTARDIKRLMAEDMSVSEMSERLGVRRNTLIERMKDLNLLNSPDRELAVRMGRYELDVGNGIGTEEAFVRHFPSSELATWFGHGYTAKSIAEMLPGMVEEEIEKFMANEIIPRNIGRVQSVKDVSDYVVNRGMFISQVELMVISEIEKRLSETPEDITFPQLIKAFTEVFGARRTEAGLAGSVTETRALAVEVNLNEYKDGQSITSVAFDEVVEVDPDESE